MQVIITEPIEIQLPQELVVPLLLGYIHLGHVPSEVSLAVDKLPQQAIPPGCKMIVEMWQNRGDEAETLDLIRHMTNEVLS